ncbi:MAG TPA: leucine-rich repeat protein [Acholeplasmataceae bacterium]|nr:leucine-rich repeat protein [Acholeplasmataceae bacterium]
MRKIKFCFTIVLVLMLLISCLPKKSSEKAITNVNGLTWDGETITADLHQADSFSFSGRISVSRGATWNLYLDEEGKTPVFNKVLTLSDGENQAFIIVKAEDGSTKVYQVIIVNHTKPANQIHYQPQDDNFSETEQLSPSTVSSHDETLENLLSSLTLEGHRFVGWYYDEERTELAKPTDSLTQDITLYAKWEYLELKVKFIDDETVEEINSFYSDTVHQPSVTPKEGYVFLGWFEDLQDEEPVGFPFVLKETLELYAKWEEKTFLVKFVTNGDTTIDDQLVGYWQSLHAPVAPQKKGYTFKGWYKNANLSDEMVSFPLVVRSPLKLYGDWEINQHRVQFVTNTDLEIDDFVVDYQTTIFAPGELTKPDYKFEGWYDNPDMTGNPISFPYTIEKDTTFYARWTFVKTMSEGLIFSLNEDEESYQVIGFTGSDATVLVPETFNNKPVTRINQSAFANNDKIYRVIFPDSVEKIDARAFQNCINLRSMILPLNLKVLETETFDNCDSLEFVLVNERVQTIEDHPFRNAKNLMMVSFKGNPPNVDNYIFNHTPFKSMIIVCDPESEVARIVTENYEDASINQMIDLVIEDPKALAEQWDLVQPYYLVYNQSGDKTPRDESYNHFASELNEKTLEVSYSEELYYAIVHGLKPIPIIGSPAEQIYEQAKQVLRTIIFQEMNDVQKLLAINDWLVQNVHYDYDLLEKVVELENNPENPENFRIRRYTSFYLEGVFKEGIAVCDGYAKAFHLLCAMEGIVAERIVGDVVRGAARIGHAWNKVFLDGEWLIVDSTWSDGGIAVEGETKEILLHNYFLVPESAIVSTHIEEEPEIYPISETSDNLFAYYRMQTFTLDDFQGDYFLDSVEELIKLFEAEKDNMVSGKSIELFFGFDYGETMYDEVEEAFNSYPTAFFHYNPLLLDSSGILILTGK